MVLAILAAAVQAGLDTNPNFDGGLPMAIVDRVIKVLFTLEVCSMSRLGARVRHWRSKRHSSFAGDLKIAGNGSMAVALLYDAEATVCASIVERL